MSSLPVQYDRGYFSRFTQININPFFITGFTRPTTAITGINRGTWLSGIYRNGGSNRFLTESKVVCCKIQMETIGILISGGIQNYRLAITPHFFPIQIIDFTCSRKPFLLFQSGIDHFYTIISITPLNMNRFTRLSDSPVSPGQVIIIIIGLPYQ